MKRKLLSLAAVCAAFLAVAGPANAIDSVTLKVGVPPGGAADVIARVVASHLGRFLDGNPNVNVENVPGTGGFLLRTNMRTSEPNDGTVIAFTTLNHTLSAVLEPDTFGFTGQDVRWVGALTDAPTACAVSVTSPIATVEDFVTESFRLGATSRNAPVYREPAMLRAVLGANFEIITGFTGAPELNVAIERGELTGFCGVSLYALIGTQFGENKRIIGYLGPTPQLEEEFFPLVSLIDDELDRSAAEFLGAPSRASLSLALPPGTTDELVQEYRQAFDAMMADPALLEELANLVPVLTPITGEEIEAIVTEILETPEEVVVRARELIQ